jgi:glycosyltransferase involved in cell wall biosynthesis
VEPERNAAAGVATVSPAPFPTRVLYVVSLFPCWSETFIVREIHALIERGVDVRILSLKPPSESMVQPRAAVLLDRVLHPRGLASNAFAGLRALVRQPSTVAGFVATLVGGMWRQPAALGKSLIGLLRTLGQIDAIRRFDAHVVHAPWATYPATAAWFLSRLLCRPFSFTSRAHDIFVEDHMMASKLRHAALAVTITEYNVRYLERWMNAPGAVPVRVVHSSLDLSELPYTRAGRAPDRLLSVGRLDPIKGFDVLLEALAQLKQRGVEFRCTIIGEGPERARLEARRDALGLGMEVAMPGPAPYAAVLAAMASATLMVLPCVVTPGGNSDGIPNVLTEAMATGLPVVSTRVSGIPELVDDGHSGLLVAPGDATAFADAVEALLRDPERQEAFAAAGRRKVERDFDVRTEAGRLLDHFGALRHA